MNNAEKIVFSGTLEKVRMEQYTAYKRKHCRRNKKDEAIVRQNMTILGSGSIVNTFAENGLIDEYQFMVDPVVLGEGTTLFNGIRTSFNLKLTGTRTFKSGLSFSIMKG